MPTLTVHRARRIKSCTNADCSRSERLPTKLKRVGVPGSNCDGSVMTSAKRSCSKRLSDSAPTFHSCLPRWIETVPLKYASVKLLRWKAITGVESRSEDRLLELSRIIPPKLPTVFAENRC